MGWLVAEDELGAETVDEGALVEDVAEEVPVSAASKRVRSRFLLVAVERGLSISPGVHWLYQSFRYSHDHPDWHDVGPE